MAGEDLAPHYSLEVAGHELRSDITQFIQRVEYESADGIVDTARITAFNPDFLLSKSKVLAPGNEMDIWMGYGGLVSRVGRVILMTPRVSFPTDGIPIVEVTGYTKDYLMQEQKPDPGGKKRIKEIEARLSRAKKWEEKLRWKAVLKRARGTIVFRDTTVDKVVDERSSGYQFYPDIDPTPFIKGEIQQPSMMSDYQLVQGLANLTGYLFWVDYDYETGWTLHFRDPTEPLGVQDRVYTFRYNQGDKTTLLNFVPEMVFREHFTSIRVQTANRHPAGLRFGWPLEAEIHEELGLEADLQHTGAIEEMEKAPESAEAVKFFIGNFSFTTKTNVVFRNKKDLEVWASQWYRRMREQFIVGSGTVIGMESLLARQVHRLEGMGIPYDGKYYFSKVRHIMETESGYRCQFSARKILEG